jgi:hypothetical protein
MADVRSLNGNAANVLAHEGSLRIDDCFRARGDPTKNSMQRMRSAVIQVRWTAWLCLALLAAPTRAAEPQNVMAELSTGLFSTHFDSEYAARLVLGMHWREASAEQRQQSAAALYQRLLRTYADSVIDWTPDRFRLLPVLADPAALRVTVHTLIINSHSTVVPVDFRMHGVRPGSGRFLAALSFISGCTALRPIDGSPAELQQRIAAGDLLKTGDRILITTSDAKTHRLTVSSIDAELIQGRSESARALTPLPIFRLHSKAPALRLPPPRFLFSLFKFG